MRSWGARSDAAVSDEPFYAHYLSTLAPAKRSAHPAAEEVLQSQPTSWREVADAMLSEVPGGKAVWYQKHMAHHATLGMDLGFLEGLTNIFLIRDPAAMIASFSKVIPNPSAEDLGLPQQVRLFEHLRERTGRAPAVFDASDILADPRRGLGAMCEAAGVAFDPAMLAWERGPRETDGVWAPHWYSAVYESTGFRPLGGAAPPVDVPDRLRLTLDRCRELYGRIAAHRTLAG